MSKRTLFLIFALFIITSVLLVINLYNPSLLNTKAPIPTPIPTKEPVEQTALLLGEPNLITTPSSISGLKYSLPISISTGKNQATAVQLELQYDPQILTSVTVLPGPFFKDPNVLLNQIDTKTGRISYAFGIGLMEKGVMGTGIVATLTFEAKLGIAQQTAILFLPKTLVTADEITQSVLKTTKNALFTVGIVPSVTPSAPPIERPAL